MKFKEGAEKKTLFMLLSKNLSRGQLIGYALANIVGLTVILSGIMFFCDSRHNIAETDKFFSDDYIVISKKVKGINLDPLTFTEEEIRDIEIQPWVKKIGKFTASQFPVSCFIDMGGKGFSSQLFLESVPEDFYEIKPDLWGFNTDENFIPIVLNKDYLALYNFGFAAPHGLPQLSEEMIGNVPLKLKIIAENGDVFIFNAAVVGFSSRLNTIAVPQEFIDWANKKFVLGEKVLPSRLIIKIDRFNFKDLKEYLISHNLEVDGDKDGDSKISEFLSIVSSVVAANGLIISALALFILILSIFLLLQKSRSMLHDLLLLGYSPRQLSKYYERIVLITNSLITILAIGFTFLCRQVWTTPLSTLGLGKANVLFMLGAALLYFVIISLLNILLIRRNIDRIWFNR